jgi:glycosyltransferase involved in cell wall biosynthesis
MKKRIAVIGNMNNNFVALTKYLRDVGYDAHLFYMPAADHFRPIADSFETVHPYYHEVSWMHVNIHMVDEILVHEQLKGFDFYIGQGTEAAIAKKCGYNMDIYFPYGSDFYKYAWLPMHYTWQQILFKVLFTDMKFAELRKGTGAVYTRQVIKEAKNVCMDKTNPETEKRLFDIGLLGRFHHIPMPFIYLPQYQNRTNWDVHWKSNIDDIRARHDFVLVYHGRHESNSLKVSGKNDFTTKNTNYLIEGFSKFVKQNHGAKPALITIDYGSDVSISKDIILANNIESNVYWLPKMYRKDLMYLLSKADVGSGEFDVSNLTFGTIIEAMAMGKPVIHYREDSLYKGQYPELYPMYNAREPEQIAQALQEAYDNPEERIAKGAKAQDWVKKFFIERPLEQIIELIEEALPE